MCVCAIGRMVSGAGAELTAAGVAQTHLRVENMPLTLSLLCSPDEEDDDVRGACCCGAESEMPPANTRQSKQAVRRKEGGGMWRRGGKGKKSKVHARAHVYLAKTTHQRKISIRGAAVVAACRPAGQSGPPSSLAVQSLQSGCQKVVM